MAEECANPLLAQFLKEWWDVAKERNSKGATTCVRETTVNTKYADAAQGTSEPTSR